MPELSPSAQVLYIGHVWPEPDSSAAGYRTLGILEAFIENDFSVAYCSAASENEYSINLRDLGIDSYSIELNNSKFDQLLEKVKPDIVIFDRFMTEEQYAWRVDQVLPKAIKILETCDLHFLRRARQKAIKQTLKLSNKYKLSQLEHLELQSEDAIREIAAILRCDLSLIISSEEYSILIDRFNLSEKLLLYLPFMLEINAKSYQANFEQRKNFIQIGNFLHEPNWDALLWCKQKLWPAIRKQIPEAEFHIYGAYTSDKVKQLHNEKNGFLIKGRAFNLPKLMPNYRVNLAPLRFGAGIKGKIADGFIHGLPCVTTSIGAEGMCGELKWGTTLADNEDSFIHSAVNLYQDENSWIKAREYGLNCIKTIHHQVDNKKRLIQHVQDLIQNIESHRKQNFIGTMLNYHHHQRTKYLSRWIEEKNKKTTG